MVSPYPASIPIRVRPTSDDELDSLEVPHAAGTAEILDDAQAVMETLGRTPQGTYPTVRARLDAVGIPEANGSGFPMARAGEKVWAKYFETASLRAPDQYPLGGKPLIVAESFDTPGVLRHIWIATDNGGATPGLSNFQEAGSFIRIFVDDDTTPRIEMTLGDFFMYYPMCDVFHNERIGRTTRELVGYAASGAYRYLWMPYHAYLRVEIEQNDPSVDVGLLYAVATFSEVDDFDSFGSQQLNPQVAIEHDATHTARTPMTVCDISGAGQLEALHLRFEGASSGDGGIMEGNVLIYIDGEERAAFRTSGGEDFFDGSWYAVPVGGYPSGRAGESEASSGTSMWRFFDSVPIFFTSSLKIVWWVGQLNQGTVTDATVDAFGAAYYWLNSGVDIEYTVPDFDATPIYQPPVPPAGSLPAWAHAQDGVWTVDSSGRFVQADETKADAIIYLNATSIDDEGIWVESTVRITNASAAGQEAFVWAADTSEGGYLGVRASIELYRDDAATKWYVRCRDNYDQVGGYTIGDSVNLTGVEIDLALRCLGTRVTGYWKYHNEDRWQGVISWESDKGPFERVGVATWTADATFTPPIVRPLKTVTNAVT